MLSNFKIELKFLKKARRATLRVFSNFRIKLTLPTSASKVDAIKILEEKSDWILKHHKLLESVPKEKIFLFNDGEKLPYLGFEIVLKYLPNISEIQLIENELVLGVYKVNIKKKIIDWYKEKSLKLIEERCLLYSKAIGVTPRSIQIKNYKSRWGACSSRGDLVFNWQIICLEEELFNYVVAHEVCHLREMNHSKKFEECMRELGFNHRQFRRKFKNVKNPFSKITKF